MEEITKELITASIILPMVWYFIRQNTKFTQQVIKELREQTSQLSKLMSLTSAHNEEARQSTDRVLDKIKNNNLEDYQAIRLLRSEMWLTSKKKLDFIQNILLNNHIKGREEFIKDKVKSGLRSFSEEYMTNFKSFNTRVGRLDKWLDNNFSEQEFEKLLEEVYHIMFRSVEGDKVMDTYYKKQEISLIMDTLQNDLAQKLKKDLSLNS